MPSPNESAVEPGTLYVVATPIGNLGDLTFRALDVLRGVQAVACEDTRRTLKLLNHFGLSKPLVSLYGPKERRAADALLDRVARGEAIAFVTDAGTPGLSDPGQWLVRRARERSLRVRPVPGASAVAAAVSVAGCAEDGFLFVGFLHRKKSRMRKELAQAAALGKAIVFLESPYRLKAALEAARDALGGATFCWVGRELTKKFEEHLAGTLDEVIAALARREVLGEVTVVLKQ